MGQNVRILFIPPNTINPLNQLSGTITLLRCQRALKIWHPEKFDYIVTAGGIAQDKSFQTIPTGILMKEWLIDHQIPQSKIIPETKSLDTYTNLRYSLKILRAKHFSIKKMTIISHWTHLLRMRIILWRNYKIKPICVPIRHRLSLIDWIHEIIWLPYTFIDKTGNGFPQRMIRKHAQKLTRLAS